MRASRSSLRERRKGSRLPRARTESGARDAVVSLRSIPLMGMCNSQERLSVSDMLILCKSFPHSGDVIRLAFGGTTKATSYDRNALRAYSDGIAL